MLSKVFISFRFRLPNGREDHGGNGQEDHDGESHPVQQAVLFPADVRTLSAGNVNELTGILRGNPRVMSMHEEFKRL